MKRFLAVFLALVVCLGIIVPANAATNATPVITGISSGTIAAGGIVHITGKNFLVENTNIASLSVFLFHDDGGANMLASVSNGRYIEWSQNKISFRIDKDTVPQSGELVVVVNNVYGKWGERFSIVAPGGKNPAQGPLKTGPVTRSVNLNFELGAGQPKGGVVKIFIYTGGYDRIDGVEIHLSFDPKKVKITDKNGKPVNKLVPESKPLNLVLLNKVDNKNGSIDFAAGTLKKPLPRAGFPIVTFYVQTIENIAELYFVFDETRNKVNMVTQSGDDILLKAADVRFKVQQ